MRSVRGVCPYCGVGCGLLLDVGGDGRINRVRGDPDHPANRGRLCTKGQTCAEPITAPGRLDAAYLRSDRGQHPARVPMSTAITETARRLRALIDREGPDAVALYVSGQMSLEAQYLANKLAKGFIGTNQIESNSRLCMASAASGYKRSLGSDGPPGSYEDFEHTALFFVIGANMADSHPILHLRMLERIRQGARLIVVDPRRTGTADKAHLHLPIRPGTDLALLNGLLHLLHRNGHTDAGFIARHTAGWEAMPDFLADYTPERVSALTGLSEADIRQAATWIGEAPAWMSCWTMGLNQSTQGTLNTQALCNLHLATGAICRPGAGPFSLTGQPNAMGGREMGYLGAGLPGQRSVSVEADRQVAEDVWGLPRGRLHERTVGGTVAMFEQMAAGRIKACWIICTNPVASMAQRDKVIAALRRAELVITQDAYLDTETNRHADILLPGALWVEGEGVMVNSERNLTLAQQAVAPPGEALPDWQIIARVACEMGYAEAFSYDSAEAVFDELRRFWNPATGYDLRGASYARLREGPLQWPCPPDDTETRHPIRYLNDGRSQTPRHDESGAIPRLSFPTPSGRALFFATPHAEPPEPPDAEFPLVLNTGRLQHHWHTMTKTGRSATLRRLHPGPFIEIHPVDAAGLGIAEQDQVEVRSRRGQAVLPARLSDRVRAGNCFVPIHWNDEQGEDLAINALTSDAVDPHSQQPGFKHNAVALCRVAAAPRAAEPDRATEAWSTGPHSLTLLWGSQTGRAEGLARKAAAGLRRAGWQVNLRAMDRCSPAELPAGQPLLVVTSTFGDGDPPDNAQAFWHALQAAPAGAMAGRALALLALGDTRYAQFCGFGRRLEARLQALGATPLLPRLDAEPGAEGAARRWLASLAQLLAARTPGLLPVATAALAWADDHGVDPAEQRPAGLPSIDRDHPALARLARNRLLSGAGSGKEVRALVFDTAAAGLEHEVGDALGVWPLHDPALVAELLEALALPAEAPVQLEGLGQMPLGEALLRHLDITRITPELLGFVQERSADPLLAELLRRQDEAARRQWLWGRQLVDLLRAHPVRCSAQTWVAQLRPLQPRLYSIASSPRVQPGEVQLLVSTLRYRHQGRARGGVCSSFLADRAAQAPVPVFVQPSAHFRPPVDGRVPLVMIGPGTGLAPFRAFLQDRRARGHAGRNWLFFGEQHAATDFYHREELLAMQADGVLTRLSLAFSRDQADKLYVQHRMREQGRPLWAWLQEGAVVCVCGDALRMARDVDRALQDIARIHGGLAPEAAAAFPARLAAEGRYLRDVY